MSRAVSVDPEVQQLGRAVKTVRERLKLTQAQAAEAGEMTSQYWGMHETGKVPGIVKPATQRALLDALTRAAGLDEPLGLGVLEEALEAAGAPAAGRLARMARELGPVGGEAETRRAVFPVPEGDVVIEIPAAMTPEGFKQVEAYIAVFLKANSPKG